MSKSTPAVTVKFHEHLASQTDTKSRLVTKIGAGFASLTCETHTYADGDYRRVIYTIRAEQEPNALKLLDRVRAVADELGLRLKSGAPAEVTVL